MWLIQPLHSSVLGFSYVINMERMAQTKPGGEPAPMIKEIDVTYVTEVSKHTSAS